MAKKRIRNPEETRRRLVEGAISLMLRQGYSATTVDEICAASELTKGSFFHHFESKEDIAKAAVAAWGEMGTSLYQEAWRDETADPLDQINLMIDIMIGFTERPEVTCTCMVGMMSQELAETSSKVRGACEVELANWTKNVAILLEKAKLRHTPTRDFEADEVAWFLNSVWQGSMLIGKVRRSPEMIRRNLEVGRSYVVGLFK